MPRQFLDEPVVLLNGFVQIFDLQDFNQPATFVQDQEAIQVLQPDEFRIAFIDGHFVGETVVPIAPMKNAVAAASS